MGNKRLLYFFGRHDEKELSEALNAEFPALKFIDGERWPEAKPPLALGIHQCESSVVYLWFSDLVSELPVRPLPEPMRLAGKKYQGPSTDVVMQFVRCNEKHGQLEMSQLAAFIKDPLSPLGKAQEVVIAFLRKRYSCRLDCFALNTERLLKEDVRGYLVGFSTQAANVNGPRLVLAFGRDEYLSIKR